MKHPELVERLDRAADRFTERVLGEMYKNPFWQERFGERANRHGRQDGRFHIDYLMQAVGSDDVAVFENYARWLQQVLTSRGMSSKHLAENFERLGRAISDERWADGAIAVKVLDAGVSALRYRTGAAREVQEHARVIVVATAEVLYVRHPEWQERWGAAGRVRCIDDIDYHVSYGADALALELPNVFIDYARWMADFLARRNMPRDHLVETFEVIAAVHDTPAPLRTLLRDAIGTLAS